MLHRHLTGPLLEALADTPAVLVNGARQTGKSTLAQSAEVAGQKRQYLTFDDPGILAAAKRDPNGFVAGLNSLVTLDEIQHVPELFSVIKAAIPRQPAADERAGRLRQQRTRSRIGCDWQLFARARREYAQRY